LPLRVDVDPWLDTKGSALQDGPATSAVHPTPDISLHCANGRKGAHKATFAGTIKPRCSQALALGTSPDVLRYLQPIGHCTICRDAIGDGIGQDYLRHVNVAIAEQRIALIDEIENCTHDQRDKK
jgi:hypothetical protein